MKVQLIKEMVFEAAHRRLAGDARVQRLHGHSYRLEVLASGEVTSPEGWLVDYGEIREAIGAVYDTLDHAFLNDLPGLDDPSLSALGAWIEGRVTPRPAWFDGVRVRILGDRMFAPTRLEADADLPERIRFTFEAAQSLPQLPADHPCRNMHGHSYRIQAGAADLEALGPLLQALYDELDHQCLNEVPGLASATCERMCEWIWKWLTRRGARPTVVVVQETGTARCVYHGE